MSLARKREKIEGSGFIQTDKIKTQESEKNISQEQNWRGEPQYLFKNQIPEPVIDEDNLTGCLLN